MERLSDDTKSQLRQKRLQLQLLRLGSPCIRFRLIGDKEADTWREASVLFSIDKCKCTGLHCHSSEKRYLNMPSSVHSCLIFRDEPREICRVIELINELLTAPCTANFDESDEEEFAIQSS